MSRDEWRFEEALVSELAALNRLLSAYLTYAANSAIVGSYAGKEDPNTTLEALRTVARDLLAEVEAANR